MSGAELVCGVLLLLLRQVRAPNHPLNRDLQQESNVRQPLPAAAFPGTRDTRHAQLACPNATREHHHRRKHAYD
eukprot:1963631-Rhodomonas_salina.1